MLDQLVATQSECGVPVTPSSETTRVGQIIRLNPPTFISIKVVEDPQCYFDEMEKIFHIIHVINMERIKFVAYQLKDVAY